MTQVGAALAPKATKTYVDSQLVLKANQSTSYTKTEVYEALALKPPDKSYVDTQLALK